MDFFNPVGIHGMRINDISVLFIVEQPISTALHSIGELEGLNFLLYSHTAISFYISPDILLKTYLDSCLKGMHSNAMCLHALGPFGFCLALTVMAH